MGVSRFHRVRLRTITKITGMTRNSTTPIRLGVRKRNAVRTRRRRSGLDAAFIARRFPITVVAAAATLIAPPGTAVRGGTDPGDARYQLFTANAGGPPPKTGKPRTAHHQKRSPAGHPRDQAADGIPATREQK